MLKLFKQYFINKIKYSNNSNNNKNNLNNKMAIISLGHYQSKSSLNSEKPEIIRIIGPANEREGFWISQDKKIYNEYDLEENWILLDTHYSEKQISKPPINIFAGLFDIDDEKINQEEYDNFQTNNIVNQQIIENLSQQTPQQIKIVQEEPKIPFDISIIDKINIDKLNKKNFEKFGIVDKYKKPTIFIDLPIEFNYDINKLKQIIELLGLDENIILDFLVKQISTNSIYPLIKDELKKLLKKEENFQEEIIQKIEIYEEPEKQIINNKSQEDLLNNILEISEYLNNKIIKNN